MNLFNPVKGLLKVNEVAKLGDVTKTLAKTKTIPVPVVDAANEVVEQVTELMRIREIEQTKREDIAARRDTALAAISSQKEIILECMRSTFAERAAVLQEDFKVIDQALERNDVQMLNAALTNMVQVIQTSPFQAIQQVVETKGTLRLE